MLIADLEHFTAPDFAANAPGPARRLGDHLIGIVRAATAGRDSAARLIARRCRRRPQRVQCGGRIVAALVEEPATVEWACTVCGESGRITGWEGTPYDLSPEPAVSEAAAYSIPISEESYDALTSCLLLDREAERLLYGAEPISGGVQLHGSNDDWDPFLDAVAGEANHAPPARRRKLDAALHEVELARDAQRRARPAPQGRPATIPELTRRAAAREAERFCDDRVPARVRHQVRLEVDDSDTALTIVERRVPWNAKGLVEAEDWTRMPIALLRWFDDHVWRLFYCDSRDRWHLDTDAPASATVGDLLRHLNEDKTGIYWG